MITKELIAFFLHLAEKGISVTTFVDYLEENIWHEDTEEVMTAIRSLFRVLSHGSTPLDIALDVFDWGEFTETFSMELSDFMDTHWEWRDDNNERIDDAWQLHCNWIDFESAMSEVPRPRAQPVTEQVGRSPDSVPVLSDEVRTQGTHGAVWNDELFRRSLEMAARISTAPPTRTGTGTTIADRIREVADYDDLVNNPF